MNDRGQAGVLVLGLLAVALAVAGVAVDVARAFAERAAIQARADAAALAATSAVDDDALLAGDIRLDPADAERRARAVLARNGVTGGVRVEARGDAVTVAVKRPMATVFLHLIGIDTVDISASATASARRAARLP